MATHSMNVTTAERWVTGLGGAAMALEGLRRRTPGGMVAAAGGGALLLRAATGHCPAYQAMGIHSTSNTRRALSGAAAGACHIRNDVKERLKDP